MGYGILNKLTDPSPYDISQVWHGAAYILAQQLRHAAHPAPVLSEICGCSWLLCSAAEEKWWAPNFALEMGRRDGEVRCWKVYVGNSDLHFRICKVTVFQTAVTRVVKAWLKFCWVWWLESWNLGATSCLDHNCWRNTTKRLGLWWIQSPFFWSLWHCVNKYVNISPKSCFKLIVVANLWTDRCWTVKTVDPKRCWWMDR